jgi:hypothetical protein
MNIYFYEYSKHVYTQHEFLVLVLLKVCISTDYCDFVELIDIMNDIKKLDLNKTPHFTTFQKFVFRIPSFLFNILLLKTLKLFTHIEKLSRLQQLMQQDLQVPIQVIIIPAD